MYFHCNMLNVLEKRFHFIEFYFTSEEMTLNLIDWLILHFFIIHFNSSITEFKLQFDILKKKQKGHSQTVCSIGFYNILWKNIKWMKYMFADFPDDKIKILLQ